MELPYVYLKEISVPSKETVLVHEAAHARHDSHSIDLSPVWEELATDSSEDDSPDPDPPDPKGWVHRRHHKELIIDTYQENSKQNNYKNVERRVIGAYNNLPGLLRENVHHIIIWPKLRWSGLYVSPPWNQPASHHVVKEDIAETVEMFYGARRGLNGYLKDLEKQREEDAKRLGKKLDLLIKYEFLEKEYASLL